VRGVDVIGEVEDVLSFVRRFRVSVAPLLSARGLQNKVLEAMGAGKPVVLTSAAAAGIAALDDRHYLIADNPADFSAKVLSLLGDTARCAELGRAAREHVAGHHCWDREMSGLESLLHVEKPVAPA
jgi:glycosyltransferase involved in cell wall biosynthesis